jgi:hypothetical protein
MSGANHYYDIYYDIKHDVYIRVDCYQKYSSKTTKLLKPLLRKEKRLRESTPEAVQAQGKFHSVRFTYPNAITPLQYRMMVNT